MKNRNYKILAIICLLFVFVLPVYAQQAMSGVLILMIMSIKEKFL